MFSTCSIEFFGNCYLLTYPNLTNTFAVNQIILYNGVFAITKNNYFFSTVALPYSRVPLYCTSLSHPKQTTLIIIGPPRL